MTTSGDLRHLVAFDRREDTNDGYGNVQTAFAPQFEVRASIQAKFGGETVTAARLQGQQPVTIVIRQSHRTREIREDWRARDVRTGQVYAIRSIVDPDQKRQWLEILTQTGVAQ